MADDRVRRVQELRRSSAARPIPSRRRGDEPSPEDTMRSSRYADYPPEWDNEPEDSDDFPAYDEVAEEAARRKIEHDDVAVETPWGTPADDVWHAQRAEDRDRFLHPPDPD